MKRKVLLICAGGMSTGLLMKKMETYAKDNGYDLDIKAVGFSDYEDVYRDFDMILLGPQVSYKKAEIAEATNMPIDIIATYDYAVGNVTNIFKQVNKIYETM